MLVTPHCDKLKTMSIFMWAKVECYRLTVIEIIGCKHATCSDDTCEGWWFIGGQ